MYRHVFEATVKAKGLSVPATPPRKRNNVAMIQHFPCWKNKSPTPPATPPFSPGIHSFDTRNERTAERSKGGADSACFVAAERAAAPGFLQRVAAWEKQRKQRLEAALSRIAQREARASARGRQQPVWDPTVVDLIRQTLNSGRADRHAAEEAQKIASPEAQQAMLEWTKALEQLSDKMGKKRELLQGTTAPLGASRFLDAQQVRRAPVLTLRERRK